MKLHSWYEQSYKYMIVNNVVQIIAFQIYFIFMSKNTQYLKHVSQIPWQSNRQTVNSNHNLQRVSWIFASVLKKQ